MTALFLLPVLSLVACPAPDKVGVDSVADSGALGDGPQLLIASAAQDFSTGAFASLDLVSGALHDSLFVSSSDPKVVVTGGAAWLIGRSSAASLRRYAVGEWDAPVWERDLGAGSNPQDAAACGGRLFVSLYEEPALAIVDPETGDLLGEVDLSAYQDADGLSPEPNGLRVLEGSLGDTLYVALERLDRAGGWVDAGGKVVEVDCASGEAARAWDLGGNTGLHPWDDGERLLVSARAYGAMGFGGLFLLTPSTGALAPALDDGDLGGAVVRAAAEGDTAVLIGRSDDNGAHLLACVDLLDSGLTEALSTSDYLTDVKIYEGVAYVSAHWGWADPDSAKAGVYALRLSDCTLESATPTATTLGPVSLAVWP